MKEVWVGLFSFPASQLKSLETLALSLANNHTQGLKVLNKNKFTI